MSIYPIRQPVVKSIGDQLFRLEEPYSCMVDYDGLVLNIMAPKGYIYDGMSIPRIAWTITGLTPYGGPWDWAVLTHDICYDNAGDFGKYDGKYGVIYIEDPETKLVLTRIESDGLMQFMCELSGVPKRQRNLMYAAVRAFGRRQWGKPGPMRRNA